MYGLARLEEARISRCALLLALSLPEFALAEKHQRYLFQDAMSGKEAFIADDCLQQLSSFSLVADGSVLFRLNEWNGTAEILRCVTTCVTGGDGVFA